MDTIEFLRLEAERLRILDLKAITKAGAGHPGGTLSLAEVMSTLFFGGVLRYDPTEPMWENRDRLVLSEGHTAPILYASLVDAAYKGWDEKVLMELRQNPDVIAQGHVTRWLTPGIDASTGALGMGGAKALGMALAARYKGNDYHTFCILGDGESEEGEVYEAASNTALLGVDNVTWILNRNKAQQTAGTKDVSHIEYAKWFESMGWNVVVIPGESSEPAANRIYIQKLQAALLEAKKAAHHAGRPTIIIADTIKGKGVDFMEYANQPPLQYKFHGVAPTPEELTRALPQIEARMTGLDAAALSTFRKQSAMTPEQRKQIDALNIKMTQERREKLLDIRKTTTAKLPVNVFKPGDKPTGTRVGFGNALAHLALAHPEVVGVSPDLQDSVHMGDLEKITGRQTKDNFLGAYIPDGIAESNAVGKCAGLGYEGLIPFVATFDQFLLEAADELQHAAAFGSFFVAVGTHSGCGVGSDGKSQMGVGTPGMVDHFSGVDADLFEMFEASDAQEAGDITRLIVERVLRDGAPRHPIYLRLTRHNVAILDKSGVADYKRRLEEGAYILSASKPSQKADVILVASGATVAEAIKAAQSLAGKGITAKVINVVSLNKISRSTAPFVREFLDDETPIITVHDAEPNALGHRVKDAVNAARLLGRKPGIVLKTLGVNISPLSNHVGSGTNEENYRRNQIDAAGIEQTVLSLVPTATAKN
jgi:transketolase